MTTILKSERFRNADNTATITVEQYQDKGCVPLWRYRVSPDSHPNCGYGKHELLRKPSKKKLAERY